MWKNIVERDRPQMTIWRMRIACWIPKVTNTHTHRLCNTRCFSTARMVERARLNVTLAVLFSSSEGCSVSFPYLSQLLYNHVIKTLYNFTSSLPMMSLWQAEQQRVEVYIWYVNFNVICLCTDRYTRVGTLIVATIYLQLIQNRYMFRSFTVLHCSHQHCLQPVASDVEVVGYL